MNPNGELTNRELNGELKRYMQAIGELPSNLSAGHPAEQKLIEHAQRKLAASEQRTIDLHLNNCLVCADRMADAQDFFEAALTGETELSEFERHQQWLVLKEKLPFERRASDPVAMAGRTAPKIGRRGMFAIAAGLLLTTSMLGLFALRLWQEKRDLQALIDRNKDQMVAKIGQPQADKNLEQVLIENRALLEKLNETQTRLEELQEPQINTPVSEITVGDTMRSEKDGRAEFNTSLPPNVNFFTIELNIVSDSFPTYRIAFQDGTGKTALTRANLKPNERAQEKIPTPRPNQKATLSFSIPRRALPAGKYAFSVHGQKGNDQVLLEMLKWSFN